MAIDRVLDGSEWDEGARMTTSRTRVDELRAADITGYVPGDPEMTELMNRDRPIEQQNEAARLAGPQERFEDEPTAFDDVDSFEGGAQPFDDAPEEVAKPFNDVVEDETSPTASFASRFTKDMDDAGNAVAYGYYSSSAGFYNILANIPGGINNLNDWLVQKTGLGVESKETVLGELENYLRGVSQSVSPDAYGIEPPKGVINKIYAGIAAAPVTVGEYVPAVKAFGMVGGFASIAGLENVDEDIDDIGIEMGKAAALGGIVKASSVLNIPERVAALGLLGFGTSGGELEDKVAAGVVFASMGAMGGKGGVGFSKKGLANFRPEKDPFVKELERLEKQEISIEQQLMDPATPKGMVDALVTAKKDTQGSIEVMKDALFTADKLSRKIYGQDTRSMGEMSGDLVTRDGKTKYEDISQIEKEVTGRLKPGKFMTHPVVKWAVDRTSRHRVNIEHNIDRILHAPRFSESLLGLTGLRSAVTTSSEGGAVTVYEKLPWKSQSKVVETLLEIEKAPHLTADVTAKTLYNRGLNEQEVKAGMSLFHGGRTVRNHYNDMVTRYGDGKIQPIEKLPNWLPHMFMGNFRVYVRNKANGNVEQVLPASNPVQANRIRKAIEKEYGNDYEVRAGATKRASNSDVSVSAFAEAIKLMETGTPEAAKIVEIFQDVMAKRGFGKHKMERKGAGGFAGSEGGKKGAKEFLKGYKAYVEGGVKAAEAIKMRHEMSQLFTDKNVRKYPNATDYAQRYVNNAMGDTGKLTQMIQNVTRDFVGERGVSSALGGMNNATLYAKLLFGNARFIAAQGIQPFQVIPAKLMDLQIKGVEGNVFESVAKAQKDFISPSKETKMVIRYMMQNRTIEPKFLAEFAGEHMFERGMASVPKKLLDTITLRNASARVEQYSRMNAGLMFYHFLRSANVNKVQAMRDASYLTDKYMVEYNSVERPMIWGEDGIGVLGRPAGLFKTFQHNYLSQMVEHVKTAKDTKDARGLAMFVGASAVSAGVLGVMGITQADWILNSMGKESLTSRLLRSGMSEYALWGAPSAASGVDITSTLSAPGMGASDLLSFPSLEYVGKTVAMGFTWAKRFASGTATAYDAENFYKAIAPTSLHGAIEYAYQNKEDDIYRDPNKKGRGVLNRDNKDWVSRYLSGRSIKESTLMKYSYELSVIEKNAADNQETLVALGTYLTMTNEDIPDWLFDKMIDNGFTGKQYVSSIRSRIKLQATTLEERLISCKGSLKCAKRLDMMDDYAATILTEPNK